MINAWASAVVVVQNTTIRIKWRYSVMKSGSFLECMEVSYRPGYAEVLCANVTH
jgi:hypothetical protein